VTSVSAHANVTAAVQTSEVYSAADEQLQKNWKRTTFGPVGSVYLLN